MSDNTIVVRFDMEVLVELPDKTVSTEGGNVTEKSRSRSIKAALAAMNDVDVYIDGEDMEPAKVTFDVSDGDVTGVYF